MSFFFCFFCHFSYNFLALFLSSLTDDLPNMKMYKEANEQTVAMKRKPSIRFMFGLPMNSLKHMRRYKIIKLIISLKVSKVTDLLF